MASTLDKLGLFKKPVPKKKKGVKIQVSKVAADVKIQINIVDKTGADFNRRQVLDKIKKERVTHIPRHVKVKPVSIKVARKPKAAPAATPQTGPTKVIVKVPKKFRKRIKLGKTIRKGTITAIRPRILAEAKTKKGKIKVKLGKVASRVRSDVEPELMEIGDVAILDRLPKESPPISIRASSYYMNNREIFINFINSLFEPYREALLKEGKDVSCDRPSGSFSLMTHQEIVRDYINLFAPYRGLLLYHGLGAGKTCASISIAEGIKTAKQIVVMTPASLRQNYISELKLCGDPLYRLNQFWEFIPTEGNVLLTDRLSDILNLSVRYIRKQGGAWLVNVKKKTNYDSLSTDEKIQLNDQLDEMISLKYQFINYNGLRSSHLEALTGPDGKVNPFDNKVVIIDEAHNFVSRIVNKMRYKKSLSYKLYEFLMGATGCKLIFLTGTPIINYPNEIGIMFNMLRGYIKTFTFYVNVRTRQKVSQGTVEKMFSKFAIHDYIRYNTSAKTITITRNPFGFVTVRNVGVYKGVKRNAGGNACDPARKNKDCRVGYICGPDNVCIPTTDVAFVKACVGILRANDIGISKKPIVKLHKALPDTLDNFNAMFVNPKTGDIKNKDLFQRRILGLTSYFRSAQEQLMPAFDIEKDLRIVDIPMSDYQFGLYELARKSERVLEKRNAKKRRQQKEGVYSESVSTYRIFSRAFCNFVFPRAIERPKPQKAQDLNSAILQPGMDEDDVDAVSLQERIANVDGRYEAEDEGALKKLAEDKLDSSYKLRIMDALKALKVGSEEYLSPAGLTVYSPKFLQILTNILDKDNVGLNLVYSQFRTLEGIGIFALVLEQNGFTRFRIKKDDAGQWQVAIPDDKRGLPTYALYTGTEDAEEKEIIRNIYNGTWDKVPTTLRKYVTEEAKDNNHGEIIKVFMITSSGAEGITLKNTRFVHIMEPYWHPVRIEQVIGRARRICSHNELPLEERNVKVFIYLMKFADNQLIPTEAGGLATRDLLQRDVSKIDRKTPLTSDQALFEISTIKEDINKQILMAIKSSSIDCSLHAKTSDKDPVICMSFGAVSPNVFTSTPTLSNERDYDRQQKRNLKMVTLGYESVKLGGVRYALRRFNTKLPARKAPEGELYDYESYLRAVKLGGKPVLVGYLKIDKKSGKLKKLGV